jgi:hypothetical protein
MMDSRSCAEARACENDHVAPHSKSAVAIKGIRGVIVDMRTSRAASVTRERAPQVPRRPERGALDQPYP